METYELIAQAIRRRQQVVARYDGARREFCPHALGRKQERRHVLAYQFGGGSSSGLPPAGEWRCFDLEELQDVTTRSGPWHTAPNLFNEQSCLDEVEMVVQPAPPATRASRTSRNSSEGGERAVE